MALCKQHSQMHPARRGERGLIESKLFCEVLSPARKTPADELPQPVKSWDGIRAGDKFGPACLQPHQPQRSPNNRAVDLPDSPPVSEDCLYLNVWTAAKSPSAKLPVMVWIYGGAYTEGAGSTPYNHGDTFASRGVVYVSLTIAWDRSAFLRIRSSPKSRRTAHLETTRSPIHSQRCSG